MLCQVTIVVVTLYYTTYYSNNLHSDIKECERKDGRGLILQVTLDGLRRRAARFSSAISGPDLTLKKSTLVPHRLPQLAKSE